MIFKRPLQKLKSFFTREVKSVQKEKSSDPYLYTFSIDNPDQIDLKDLKKAVLQNPWSLNIPSIEIKDGVLHISVLVLSSQKGSLLEASIKSLFQTKDSEK